VIRNGRLGQETFDEGWGSVGSGILKPWPPANIIESAARDLSESVSVRRGLARPE
jgi:hypothetical protein